MGYFTGLQVPENLDKEVETLRNIVGGSDAVEKSGLKGQSHITIAHVGPHYPDTEKFAALAHIIPPFNVQLKGLGIFRNAEKTHLVMKVDRGAGDIRALRAMLGSRARSAADSMPHITVTSIPTMGTAEQDELYKKMLELRHRHREHVWGEMHASAFKLYGSTLGVCRILDSWTMLGTKEVM